MAAAGILLLAWCRVGWLARGEQQHGAAAWGEGPEGGAKEMCVGAQQLLRFGSLQGARGRGLRGGLVGGGSSLGAVAGRDAGRGGVGGYSGQRGGMPAAQAVGHGGSMGPAGRGQGQGQGQGTGGEQR